MHKIVDGIEVPLTQAEIEEFEAREAEWLAGESERLLNEIRRKRKPLLEESDYRMLPDYLGSDIEEWKAYRQALRDITLQDPKSCVWPTKPN